MKFNRSAIGRVAAVAALAAAAITTTFSASAAPSAAPFASAPVIVDSDLLVPVSGGCGPNGWRGPWGHCRYVPVAVPRGPYVYVPRIGNGCPPGYWRGPWGHCRNVPYHGRLPNGGWK